MKYIILTMILIPSMLFGVKVQDEMGIFEINYIPKRIIALQFSFVDALANVGVSPIGIADYDNPNTIIKPIRDIIKPWKSVGSRSSLSLEVLADLKPDLIIADPHIHTNIYDDLKKIAPTLMIGSKFKDYDYTISSSLVIGKVIGKEKEMKEAIKKHNAKMDNYASKLKKFNKETILYVLSKPTKVHAGSEVSFSGSVFKRLGLSLPKDMMQYNDAMPTFTLEGLALLNPTYLFVSKYKPHKNIFEEWLEESQIAKNMSAVKTGKMQFTDVWIWAKAQGMFAAELMANDICAFMLQK